MSPRRRLQPRPGLPRRLRVPRWAARRAVSSDDAATFEIGQEESEASFVIDGVLNGSPRTAVGTTAQVTGQIALDLDSPDSARVGTIRISARTFTADSE